MRRLALFLVTAAAAVSAAPAPAAILHSNGPRYAGATNEGKEAALMLSPNGRRIETGYLEFRPTCTGPEAVRYKWDVKLDFPLRKLRGGKLRVDSFWRHPQIPQRTQTTHIRLKVRGDKMSGWATDQWTDPGLLCKSGKLRFSGVEWSPTRWSGRTSQGYPVSTMFKYAKGGAPNFDLPATFACDDGRLDVRTVNGKLTDGGNSYPDYDNAGILHFGSGASGSGRVGGWIAEDGRAPSLWALIDPLRKLSQGATYEPDEAGESDRFPQIEVPDRRCTTPPLGVRAVPGGRSPGSVTGAAVEGWTDASEPFQVLLRTTATRVEQGDLGYTAACREKGKVSERSLAGHLEGARLRGGSFSYRRVYRDGPTKTRVVTVWKGERGAAGWSGTFSEEAQFGGLSCSSGQVGWVIPETGSTPRRFTAAPGAKTAISFSVEGDRVVDIDARVSQTCGYWEGAEGDSELREVQATVAITDAVATLDERGGFFVRQGDVEAWGHIGFREASGTVSAGYGPGQYSYCEPNDDHFSAGRVFGP